MNVTDTISPELSDSVLNCLGERFDHGLMKIVQMESKGEKFDTKILALSRYRAFILSSKIPSKMEHEFHFLEIHHLESLKPLQLKIQVSKEESLPKITYNLTVSSTEEVDTIIEIICLEIKKCFPDVFPLENIIPRITTSPKNRRTSLNMKLEETFPDPGPCGGFTQMYSCMCDLHQDAYMPEVAWDVDTIYLSHDSKELCLNDFDHLSHRYLVPIISALIHNNWFTKLSFRNASKLSADATREINKVLQKSSHLEQLILENVGLKGSFTQDMCTAVMANRNTVLRHINLSHNSLDDRGIRSLSILLTKLPNGLVELNLAKTGLTAEGTLHLGKALVQNNFMSTSLVKLDVSGNTFKDGDISNLTGFLAQPNSLTHINMADTECALDNVFVALFRGCCANLSHLNLAGNTFTYRRGKDVPIQVSFKQFFATSTKLKYLNLSRNKLPSEVVKEVLVGIGANGNLQDVELDLSSNELKSEGGQVIAGNIAHVNNLTTLNLSDNDLNVELGRLIDWIGQNKTLQSLDISRNMGGLKNKQLLKVLDAIVQVVQNEELSLHTLSLADNKMKFETIQIINALGSNTTLTSIDISGNGMGDIGARMLAKALQLNTKLHTVKLDGNGIGAAGFNDLANALEKNYTLKYMPTPVSDVSVALQKHPEKISASLQKIQNLLQRNHSQHKFQDEQAFRLQQGFLYTTSHQMVDRLVVQMQDVIRKLIDCREDDVQADINKAQDYILDADNSKQLLAALQQVALSAESKDLQMKLGEMATQLRSIVEAQLEGSANGMIDTASEQCSNVMLNKALKESIENMCHKQTKLPPRFLQDVVEQVGAAISNRTGEAHLAMASHISDTIIDEIMEQLTESYQKLSVQLIDYRERRGSVLTNGLEMNDNEAEHKQDVNKKDSDEPPDEDKPKSPVATSPTSRLDRQSASRYQRREVGRSDSVRFKESEAGLQRKMSKVRPRSVIMKDFELTLAELEETDSGGDKLENDNTDGAVISKPPPSPTKIALSTTKPAPSPTKLKSPVAKVDKKTTKKAAADTKALDEVGSTAMLNDIRKNRVRPPRQRPSRPTNPVLKTTPSVDIANSVTPVNAGISDFFTSGFNDSKSAKPESHASPVTHAVNSTGSSDKPKKKGLFVKKDKKADEKSKKEEKSKKFGGLKGMFKKKHSLSTSAELEVPRGADTKQDHQPHVAPKVSEQPTVAIKEESKTPEKEPSVKVAEKKSLRLPVQRSLKTTTTPAKKPEAETPEAAAEAPPPKATEDDKVNQIKEEPKKVVGEALSKNGETAQEDSSIKAVEDNAQKDEKLEEKDADTKEEEAKIEEAKEEDKKEEVKKPETRKPGLVGAQMLGGTNMLQEMKLKAANRKSREILDSQGPKVEEQTKERTDASPVAPSSSEKPLSSLKVQLPKITAPGPTSPSGIIKSPTSPKVSAVKPFVSARAKSPMESPRKSPLEKVPSNQFPPESNTSKVLRQTTKEDVTKSLSEPAKSTKAAENEKPKIEKEKPAIKKRPLSTKIDFPPEKGSASPPVTPEMPLKSETGFKPSDILKRNSVELKGKVEDRPGSPEKKPNGTDAPSPASRPDTIAEDKQAAGAPKPSGISVSPLPRPRPAKRPISIASKTENSNLQKASAPTVNVMNLSSSSNTKPLESTQDKPQQKAASFNKPPPTVASKPRSRSMDPVMTLKIDPKPSSEAKGEPLLEVPSRDGKRDSLLSRSSDDGTMEDPDQYSAL